MCRRCAPCFAARPLIMWYLQSHTACARPWLPCHPRVLCNGSYWVTCCRGGLQVFVTWHISPLRFSLRNSCVPVLGAEHCNDMLVQ